MPRKRKNPKYRNGLPWDPQQYSANPFGLLSLDPSGRNEDFDKEEARRAWNYYRGEILAYYEHHHPAQKPWAWWQFDGPQQRKKPTTRRDAPERRRQNGN